MTLGILKLKSSLFYCDYVHLEMSKSLRNDDRVTEHEKSGRRDSVMVIEFVISEWQ